MFGSVHIHWTPAPVAIPSPATPQPPKCPMCAKDMTFGPSPSHYARGGTWTCDFVGGCGRRQANSVLHYSCGAHSQDLCSMHDGTLTNASGLTPSPPPERTKATCVAAHYNVRLLGPAFGQVSVEQTFENITPPAAVASSSTAAAAAAVPEAIFTFPVSSGARVTGMQAQFGGKTITAVLKETGAARATYEEAKSSGKATALLEADAERPDMFQMCIGAVLPGHPIKVTYTYVQPVTQLRNKCRIILPTGVSRGTYTEAKHAPSGRPADDGFGTVLRISGKIQGTVPEFTEFTLKHVGGATVRSEKTENGGVNVDAEFSEQPASGGDVFIEYVLREGSAPFFYYVPTGEKEAVAVFSFQPLLERTVSRPSGPDAPPSLNQIIRILVDKSGSMQMGRWSKALEALRSVLPALLPLASTCKFSVGTFETTTKYFRATDGPLDITLENIRAVTDWVAAQHPDGGTEVSLAIQETLFLPLTRGGPSLSSFPMGREPPVATDILILTDGDVRLDSQIRGLLNRSFETLKTRVFAIGIGAEVLERTMKELVQPWGTYVLTGEDRGGSDTTLNSTVAEIVTQMTEESLVGAKLNWGVEEAGKKIKYQVQPSGAIFAGDRVHAYAYVESETSETMNTWKTAFSTARLECQLARTGGNSVITVPLNVQAVSNDFTSLLLPLAAGAVLLEDRTLVHEHNTRVALALQAGIATDVTSFVAVDAETAVPVPSHVSRSIARREEDEEDLMMGGLEGCAPPTMRGGRAIVNKGIGFGSAPHVAASAWGAMSGGAAIVDKGIGFGSAPAASAWGAMSGGAAIVNKGIGFGSAPHVAASAWGAMSGVAIEDDIALCAEQFGPQPSASARVGRGGGFGNAIGSFFSDLDKKSKKKDKEKGFKESKAVPVSFDSIPTFASSSSLSVTVTDVTNALLNSGNIDERTGLWKTTTELCTILTAFAPRIFKDFHGSNLEFNAAILALLETDEFVGEERRLALYVRRIKTSIGSSLSGTNTDTLMSSA